ncbi:hypothetical protein IVB14_33390 [Bradyrhizobium sp. 180]|uniref:hypothetical protein n=1 Tax=Bradyrhizobium sp. 180 TaxID=2782650 RepID=UPI001FFB2480|nr:hypothetical protein [Bradyrhizobium sp. 180]MCK1495172.1 hypothetical protein [Bradyrhizobium sp. 180]
MRIDSGQQNAARLTWDKIRSRINGTNIILDEDEEDDAGCPASAPARREEQILPARVSSQMASAMAVSLPGLQKRGAT